MLKVMSADRKRLRARAPRIEVYGRANIKVGNRVISVDLCDLSQGGVKLTLPEPIEAENEVIVSISGLEDRKSLIRWQKDGRSEEHTSELQSLMRNSYAVFCLKKKKIKHVTITTQTQTNKLKQ